MRAAATAAMIMLMLMTWWASGAADAAQPLTSATVIIAPLHGSAAWLPRWMAGDAVHESGVIACVGSGLIALAAFVRRTTGSGRQD